MFAARTALADSLSRDLARFSSTTRCSSRTSAAGSCRYRSSASCTRPDTLVGGFSWTPAAPPAAAVGDATEPGDVREKVGGRDPDMDIDMDMVCEGLLR